MATLPDRWNHMIPESIAATRRRQAGPPMTSEPTRDPVTDHLLTPRNAALVVIDYQPSQLQAVTSMDRDLLTDNIVSVARLAMTFDLPVVLSTVNVAHGQKPTIPELKAVVSDSRRSTGRRSTPGRTSSSDAPSKRPAAGSSSWPRCGPRCA
jgi:hypothetical protein